MISEIVKEFLDGGIMFCGQAALFGYLIDNVMKELEFTKPKAFLVQKFKLTI
jgi:hypothetical protein